MTITITNSGRFGDILWSLPTCRAIAERNQDQVDLYLSSKYGSESFCRLITAQDYINKCERLEDWVVQDTAPPMPRIPPNPPPNLSEINFNLGYPEWPTKPLPYYVAELAGVEIDLVRPWIEASKVKVFDNQPAEGYIAVGFSPEWKELKYGLGTYLQRRLSMGLVWTFPYGSPYEGLVDVEQPGDWLDARDTLTRATLFLGCNSGLWVLACALGTPAVIVEPEPMRHNEIFWVSIAKGGRRMTRLVMGSDGKPTFDWNHVTNELKVAWEEFG